jgi:predicted ATPase
MHTPDRVVKVLVDGLFLKLRHELSFEESQITVIAGPNGVGKTYLLRMIDDLIRAQNDSFVEAPFKEFCMHFASGDFVSVKQERKGDEVSALFVGQFGNRAPLKGTLPGLTRQDVWKIERSLGPSWGYDKNNRMFVDSIDGEALRLEEVIDRDYATLRSRRLSVKSESATKLRERMSQKVNSRFIGTDRLIKDRLSPRPYAFSGSKDRGARPVPSVSWYAKRLSTLIAEVTAKYIDLTTEKDRSFVIRVLDKDEQAFHLEEPTDRLTRVEERRRRLTNLGLLGDKNEYPINLDSYQDGFNRLAESSPGVLLVYLEDMEEKLSLFDDIEKKVELFKKYIDGRFLHKQLKVDADNGFRFLMQNVGEKPQALDPSVLSSGEQHELILLFELIFETRKGDLVLIDEPELSLHLTWQMTLLDDLRSTFGGEQVDVVVATHSPAVVENSEALAYVELSDV